MRHNGSPQRRTTSTVEYRKTRLPSGVRVVTEFVPYMRSLAIGFWIDTGSRDEPASLSGISHFIEHMVFKGTLRRKTHHIAQYLESVGGYVNAFTTKDCTCYYARVLSQHVKRAVDLLSDIVLHPQFPAREIEKEKQVIREEMRSIEEDPEDCINDYFEHAVFGKHSLGRTIIGTEHTVESLTREALLDYIARQYTASNLVIAAAGDVSHDLLVELCEKALSELPEGKRQKRLRPKERGPVSETFYKPVQQSHHIAGRIVPGLDSEDHYALSLLNTILGEGMSSRLFQRIRERYGYAYSIYSYLNLYEDAGTFGVYAASETRTMQRCLRHIEEELEELASTPVSKRELNRAREQVIGGFLLGLESMSSRMTRIGKDELIFGRPISIDEEIERFEGVTVEECHALASSLFDHRQWTAVTIAPDRA